MILLTSANENERLNLGGNYRRSISLYFLEGRRVKGLYEYSLGLSRVHTRLLKLEDNRKGLNVGGASFRTIVPSRIRKKDFNRDSLSDIFIAQIPKEIRDSRHCY